MAALTSCENVLTLRKSDFVVKTDSTGAKFVSKIVDELTKNHREDDEAEEGGIMCAVGGPFCPVVSFEKYLHHLNPENQFLFQRPKKKVTADSDVWYDNMVVGERTLFYSPFYSCYGGNHSRQIWLRSPPHHV